MDKESEIPALRAVHFRETMTTDATCKPITVNINVKESRKVVLNVNPQRKTIPNSQLRLFQHVYGKQVNKEKYLEGDTDKPGKRVFKTYLQENGRYLKKVRKTRQ